MAQWTNSSGSWPRPYRSPWGSPQIRYYQESTAASSAQINVGDLVRNNTIVTTGGFRVRRDESTAGGGANLAHIGGAQILGWAVEGTTGGSAAGTAGFVDDSSQSGLPVTRKIGVAIADGVTEFLGYFKSGGAGTTPVAASSLIGLTRGIVFDSTLNRYFIDSTNSTVADAMVIITDFPSDALGDSGGVPVVFKFLSSNVHLSVRTGTITV
jgi:hypothetical protein